MKDGNVRWLIGTWSVVLILLALVVWLATGWLTRPARAHESWISRDRLTDPKSGEWCCSHIDCAEVPKGGLTENGFGYFVAETGETIPHSRIIWRSQDGQWWRCRNMQTNATRCLIGPPPGS